MLRGRAFNPASPGAIGGTTPGPITGTVITATSAFAGPNGLITAVGFGFSGSSNSGMYAPSNGIIGLVANGTETLRIASTYLDAGAMPLTGGNALGVRDVGISRLSSGVWAIGTGVAGSFAGATKQTQLYIDYTNTGTVGAVQIDKAAGRVNLGAGQTSLTLTNNKITAASHIFLNADGAPGNVVAVQFYAVAGAGSATINAVPAITNQTAIDFFVVNAD